MQLDAEGIKVIYQGVNPVYWKKADRDEINQTKNRHGLPERYALFVGTREERKGVHRILEAQLKTGISMVYSRQSNRFSGTGDILNGNLMPSAILCKLLKYGTPRN